MTTRTRADLTEAIYRLEIRPRESDDPEPISRDEAARLAETVLRAVADGLVEHGEVKLSSFGVFTVRAKGPRTGRNPKTGVSAPIAPRNVLSFRASQVLKTRINRRS